MMQNQIPKNHMDIPWHQFTGSDKSLPITQTGLTEKASVIGRTGLMMLSCGTGAWRVRSSMNSLATLLGVTCTADIGLMSIEYTCFDGTDCYSQSLCLTNTGVNTSKLNRLERFVNDFDHECCTMSGEHTRHRLASFSVQSQRYVSYEKGFGYIVPPKIEALGEDAVAEFERQMDTMHQWYTGWQEKLGAGEGGNEDARFVLPGACETRMMVTMNVRELRHFFSLRMCSRAQWEIRALATEMHRLCMEIAPALFADAGPGCLRGACPEGEKSCGKAGEIRRTRREWLDSLADEQKKQNQSTDNE